MKTVGSVLAIMLMGMVIKTFAVDGDYDYSARRAPSEKAPVSNPPQFIVFGSDDNTSPDGLQWIVDYLASKKEKAGYTLRMSFYSNTERWNDASDPIVIAHQYAYEAGHEITNHTQSHPYFVTKQKRFSIPEIETEMDDATEALFDLAGVAKEDMKGFRTPYLAYSDSAFTAMVNNGFTYDCSVNEGIGWGNAIGCNIGSYVWPYTLDTKNSDDPSYAPGNNKKYCWWNIDNDTPIRQHSGLWELPCYMFSAPASVQSHMDTIVSYDHGGKITGLDYNMWGPPGGGFLLDSAQSLATLKRTLNLMYAGNRTPMTIGIHSQYYMDYAGDNVFANIKNGSARRWVLEQFIDWAIDKGDDIYFVSGAQVIAYMMDPVSASAFDPEEYHLATGPQTSVQEAPTDITISASSITDTASVGTVVGKLRTIDMTGYLHTYELLSGDGFEIVGSELRTTESHSKGTESVRIKTTDLSGLSFEKELTIEVTGNGDTKDEYVETLDLATWGITKDAIGSKGTTTYKKGESASAELTVADNDTTINGNDTTVSWGWVSMAGTMEKTLKGVTDVEVTYTSDKPINISLACASYGYRASLQKGTHTVKLPVEDFVYNWGIKEPLTMSDIKAVSFDAVHKGVTNLTISSLKLYGYDDGSTSITDKEQMKIEHSLQVFGLVDGRLSLAVPVSGQYNFNLYSLDGRLIDQQTYFIRDGVTSVSYMPDLAQGVVVLQVLGMGQESIRKMILQ